MRNLCIADRSPGTWLLCPETIGYVTNYITNRNIAFVTARPGICGPLDDLHRNKSRGLGAFHGLIPTCDRNSWSSAVSSSPLRFWGGADGVVTTSGFSNDKMGPCSCARFSLHNSSNVIGFLLLLQNTAVSTFDRRRIVETMRLVVRFTIETLRPLLRTPQPFKPSLAKAMAWAGSMKPKIVVITRKKDSARGRQVICKITHI